MIRRQFLKIIGQLSILGFVFKGQAEERVTSDLIPTVEQEAIAEFQKYITLSSAPLSSGPLCGSPVVRLPNE